MASSQLLLICLIRVNLWPVSLNTADDQVDNSA
jgi:hypothetical protein